MKKNIIFVDDDGNLIQGLKRMLKKKENVWSVDFALSGKEALDKMSDNDYDVIVSDYRMPEMDGLELLNIVKKKYPNIKRLLLTGQSEKEIFDKAVEMDNIYLPKPCSLEELVRKID